MHGLLWYGLVLLVLHQYISVSSVCFTTVCTTSMTVCPVYVFLLCVLHLCSSMSYVLLQNYHVGYDNKDCQGR